MENKRHVKTFTKGAESVNSLTSNNSLLGIGMSTDSVAIMTSGGDAAGMNPAVLCAAKYAAQKGMKPYLIYEGLRGLIDDEIYEVTKERTAGMIYTGGTLLRSARSKRFFDIKYRQQAYDNLQKRNIKKLIVIGGDGSFNALNQFYNDFKIPFAGIPATIDNDIPGTDYCLGVDTCQNIIRTSIDSIRDTATSFNRGFVIETMGRHCGYLAMTTALTCGAEICLVPEIEYDLNSIGARLKKEISEGRKSMIAIVAEGVRMGDHLTRWINDSLEMDARLTVLGHIQRGGSPTIYDRTMAFKFAIAAVDSLIAGNTNKIMTYKVGRVGMESIDYVANNKPVIPDLIYNHTVQLSK